MAGSPVSFQSEPSLDHDRLSLTSFALGVADVILITRPYKNHGDAGRPAALEYSEKDRT